MTIADDRLILGARDPRICVYPAAERTAGRMAVDLAFRAGLRLDPWQSLLLERSLGVGEDGRWSAFEVGMILARQNGKSAIAEARMLAGLFLFGEELIIYSAHEFKTAGEIFRRVLGLIEGTGDLRKRVKAVARSKGEEGIELLPTPRSPRGQRLRFLARSTGSGRGFSGDCVFMDECQHLGDAPVDAMMPTMLARPNPQIWYSGSAPDRDLAPCEQITRVRNRALSGEADRLAYHEWSATLCGDQCGPDCTEHDDPGDPLTWAKTNPALGSGRVTVEGIAKLHASMSYRGFARELLSVGNYPVEGGGWSVVPEAAWTATADPASEPLDPVAFAVDVNPDRSAASIAVAGRRSDGLVHLEVVEHRPGTDWTVARVAELVERWRPCAVALDIKGPAGSLEADFDAAGIELAKPTAGDVAAGCGALYDAVVRPPEASAEWVSTMRHIPHPALNAALAGAGKRPLRDAWAWDRRGASVDISPLVAITLARWAHAKFSASRADYDVTLSVY
ncbi:terminase large subunit [Actinomadura litoris]|uniref:terminase large subunit n=1 Tax=Actinomadura litoris TaxID=2678616 RepID=UPI001FA75609|nr:terminase large subunit [Actinomadura litoris]